LNDYSNIDIHAEQQISSCWYLLQHTSLAY